MNDLPLPFQIDVSEFTFSFQQLKTCIKFGETLTRLLLFLMKGVDVVISTLLKFEVIGKRLDCNFVFALSLGRFGFGKSLKNIAGGYVIQGSRSFQFFLH